MANIYKRWLCQESLKTPSSRPILIYLEFRSKPLLITVICMDPHSPKKFIAAKYCFLILGDDTSFFFFLSFFLYFIIFRFYVLLCYLFCYHKFLQKLFSIYCSFYYYYYNYYNHNYNKIVKSDWLSTALISALIGQFNRTVRVMPK